MLVELRAEQVEERSGLPPWCAADEEVQDEEFVPVVAVSVLLHLRRAI